MNLETLVIPLKIDKKGFQLDIKSLAKNVAIGVGAVAAGLAVAAKATIDWAQDLDSLQDVMGGTNKQVAALNFVARKSGVGVEKLSKGMVILEKGLVKADGTLDITGKSLKKWGVNVLDANGKLKDQTILIDDISKKYNSFSTQQERVNFLTETFGKSGADLIDFFDTLASEGGLDKVTKKVEAFGLAIDPARYEKFNRNLEELKLIGLGLAVSFTEKIMPQLEHFLGWLTTAAQSPEFKKFKDAVANLFDDGSGGGTKFDLKNRDKGTSPLETRIANLIDSVDWGALAQKLGDKTSKMLLLAIGVANWTAARARFITVSEYIFISSLESLSPSIKKSAGSVGFLTVQSVAAAIIQNSPMFTAALSTLNALADDKLREAAKTFFRRALGWAQQTAQGFLSGLPALLNVVQGMVNALNAILKKIITSFSITVNGVFGGSQTTTQTGSIGTHSTGGGANKKRATGGAVMAGQAYNVVELNKPEVFTPNTSGRIDPKKETKVVVDIDYNKLARAVYPLTLRKA